MATRTLPNLAAPRFNFVPLYAALPRAYVRHFRQTHREWWSPSQQVRLVASTVAVILVLGCVGLFLIGVVVLMAMNTEADIGWVVFTAIAASLAALFLYLVIRALRREVRWGPGWNRMTRLTHFAHLNNMTYEFERRDVRYNGAIFSLGTKAVASDVLTVKSGRGIQIGNYKSVARAAFDASHFVGGFVVIELDRRMPHMIAIARRKRTLFGGRQSIAPGLKRGQVLSLEGDFDRYFTLYAPKQYERDALYVFTPDLMVLLIDRLASYDVEIVDNRLYIYSHAPFNMLDPQTHERLASIVQVVGHKATNQTLRYSDDRTAPGVDMVAPGGLRLRRGITAGAVVGVLYFAFRIFVSFHGIH